MRERPILFSGPIVRAILDGTKTQTRRAIKSGLFIEMNEGNEPPIYQSDPGFGAAWQEFTRSPYGQPGDRLWVRETWAIKNWDDGECATMGCSNAPTHPTEVYLDVPTRAIHQATVRQADECGPWRSPIHMPRWASRLTLEVTAVTVERLQDITEDGAAAEGFKSVGDFADLWNEINAKRGYDWYTNPWVWVISFRVASAEKKEEGGDG